MLYNWTNFCRRIALVKLYEALQDATTEATRQLNRVKLVSFDYLSDATIDAN